MPVSTVIFDGDASGAVAAAKETQAAIDGVHGKSVDITVNTRGAGPSEAILAAIGERGDRASRAMDGLGRSTDRTNGSLGEHARAHDRASASARAHAGAADRVHEAVQGMDDRTERSNESLGRTAEAHDRASDAAARHQRLIDGMGSSRSKTFDDMWNSSHGKDFPGFAPPSGPTVQGRAPRVQPQLPDTTPSPSPVAERSWEMPGRAARVEALQAATNRLSVAQTRAAATSSEFHRSFQQAYESAPAGVDAMEHASRATSGLRQEMNVAQGAFRSADRDVKDLKSSFGDVGKLAGNASDGISMSGRAISNTALGAGVLVLGMGAISAGVGALGAGAAFESLRTAPGMMNAAGAAARQFEKGVKDSGQASREAALSSMPALKQAIHGLGDEFGIVGAKNMRTTIDGVRDLADSASNNLRRIEPAIGPAERAMVALGKAGLNSLGDSAGVISSFSNAVTAASPGIQQALTGTIALAGQLGNGVAGIFQAYGGDIPKIVADSEAFAKPLMGLQDKLFFADRDPQTGAVKSVFGGPTGTDEFFGTTRNATGFVTGVGDFSPEAQAARAKYQADQTGVYPAGEKPAYYASGTRVEPKDLAPVGGPGGADPGYVGQRPKGYESLGEGPSMYHPNWQQEEAQRQRPMDVASQQSSGTPMLDQAAQQRSQSPLAELRRSVGESGPGLTGTTGQLQALNQELAKTTNMSPLVQQSMQGVGSSAQQSMQQAGNAAQQGAPQFQQGMNQLAQHAQQLPPQIGSTMSMLAPALQQPLQQAIPQAAQAIQPQPMVDAMGGAMTKMVRQTQPQAESGGSDIGASVPSGFGQGVQKDIDKVVTIVEHLITKVIRAGAEGLQTASPSRVFFGQGQSVPQGLAGGIEADSALAVQATQTLMGKVTQAGSEGLNSGLQQHQNDLAQQQQSLQNQMQQAHQQLAQQQAQDPYGQGFGILGPQGSQRTAAAEQALQAEMERAAQTGDTSRLPPDVRQRIEQQKSAGMYKYADGREFDAAQRDRLQRDRGWDDDTTERVQDRLKRHKDIADEHAKVRSDLHVDALMRGGSESSVRKALELEGRKQGKAVTDGTADGLKQGQGKVNGAADDMVGDMIERSKKRLGIASPSKEYFGQGQAVPQGLAAGVTAGMDSAASTIEGVASDRGLQVGYRYATSMSTGIQSVFKSSDFQASMVPQVQNDLAKSVLGQLGLLGPAGSGASIYKTAMVAFGGTGSSSSTPVVQSVVHVYLDGQPFDTKIATKIEGAVNQIADSISAQVG